jgi:sortase A
MESGPGRDGADDERSPGPVGGVPDRLSTGRPDGDAGRASHGELWGLDALEDLTVPDAVAGRREAEAGSGEAGDAGDHGGVGGAGLVPAQFAPRRASVDATRPAPAATHEDEAPAPDRAAGTSASTPPPVGVPRRAQGPVAVVARSIGELLITAGLVVALFLGYQLWITDIFQARTQARLHHELSQTWSAPAVGDGFAVLRIPRFGADYAPVVVEGNSEAELRNGPGHYPDTAMPGEVGNFVVSGHRTTYGKPFSRLDEMRPGDPIVVEVQDRYYIYRMTRSEVVAPNRLDIVGPVPEHPGARPTEAVITMTTCHPRYSAQSRLIVFGVLDRTVGKSAGVPFATGKA